MTWIMDGNKWDGLRDGERFVRVSRSPSGEFYVWDFNGLLRHVAPFLVEAQRWAEEHL